MKLNISYFFIFLCILYINHCKSQENDSILKLMYKTKSDTAKLHMLNSYINDCEPDKIQIWTDSLFILIAKIEKQNIPGFQKKIKMYCSQAFGNLGYMYENTGDIKKALIYYNKSLGIAESIKDSLQVAICYQNLASIYDNQGDYDSALEYYRKSLKIREKIGDKKGMAYSLNNIAYVFTLQGKFKAAIERYRESQLIFQKEKIESEYALVLNNIGYVYLKMGIKDSGIYYTKKSMDIRLKINDKIGLVYSYANLSDIEFDNKNLNLSLDYAQKGYDLAKKLNRPVEIKNLTYLLSKINRERRDFKSAFNFYFEHIAMRDSITNEENKSASIKQQLKYDYEKQKLKIKIENQKKVELSQEKVKKQRLVIYIFIAVFILIIVFTFLFFREYFAKKKANRLLGLQNAEIIQKNVEISVQRDEIQNKKNEIEIIHEELTDSIHYAQRIQTAVLPPESYLKKIFFEFHFLPDNFFILFKPKNIVSGDFYWTTQIGDFFIITVADCTGHGVPGAFMSILGISFLNEIVRKKEITKACEVLNNLRCSIIEALQQKGQSGEQQDGMDIAFCAINLKTLEIQFAGANNPLWIVRKLKVESYKVENYKVESYKVESYKEEEQTLQTLQTLQTFELYELKGDKQPIGIYENMKPFTNHIYQLEKGDTIYLMSDGYEDQFGGENHKKFLSKNLKQLLMDICQFSMEKQKKTLETTLSEWMGNNEQIDDITIIGIKI